MTPPVKRISRSQTNFIIDIFMMLVMMLTAGVGLLIKYVLLPGFQRNIKYGRDVDLAFWGLDRHAWGTVHLVISMVLVALVLLHILLHWRQIKCLYRNLVRNPQQRIGYAFALLFICVVLAIGPLFIKPQVVASAGHGVGHLHSSTIDDALYDIERSGNRRHEKIAEQHDHTTLSEEIPVYGYMTLFEVAQQYGVSALDLAQHLGVPEAETNRRLGRLRREYVFQMSEIRDFIATHQNSGE